MECFVVPYLPWVIIKQISGLPNSDLCEGLDSN